MSIVPPKNKLTEMRAQAVLQEESRLGDMLGKKSAVTRFLLRLRMKRKIEKQLRRRLGPEYFVLRSRENRDLPEPVIH
jgi:hypothetical protein